MKKVLLALLLLAPLRTYADTITFVWDAVTTGVDGQPVVGLIGYKLYTSKTSGVYAAPVKTVTTSATPTSSVIEPLIGKYFAVVTAYNEAGESAKSSEVSYEVKAKVPTAPVQFKTVP